MTCEACKRRSEALKRAGSFGEVVKMVANKDFWFNSEKFLAEQEIEVTLSSASYLKSLGHARDKD